MAKVEDNNYYQISGWMLNQLGLKGTNLLVYAIVYGFSQDGEGEYNGSLQYLAEFTGASRRTVINALKELTDKGYLLKEERKVNGVKFNAYKSARGVQNLHGGSENSARGVVQFLHGGGAISAPNNKYNNKELNNKDNNMIIEFDTLWEMYPKKQGKQKAKSCYLSARKKGTSYEDVKDGIERYRYYIDYKKIDPQYIKQGSTFFSQQAWEDEWMQPKKEDDWGGIL